MASLILQTNIELAYYNNLRFVKLQKGQFILFSEFLAFLFNKNLSFKLLDIRIEEDEYFYQNNIRSVKQIKSGKILICNNHLYIYTLKSNEIKKEKIGMPNTENYEKILDVVECEDGTILGISTEALYNIIIKEEKNEIIQIYKFPEKWLVSWENKDDYNGYLDLYILKENKLLIHSHSYYYSRRCLNCSPTIYSESKIFIINLNKFGVIYSEQFPNIANIVVLNDYICINHSDSIYIYDINSYKILQKIEPDISNINKYADNILIANNNYEVTLYDISNINNIKYYKFEDDFMRYFLFRKMNIYKLTQRCILTTYSKIKIYEIVGKVNYKLLNVEKKTIKKNESKKNKNKKKKYK